MTFENKRSSRDANIDFISGVNILFFESGENSGLLIFFWTYCDKYFFDKSGTSNRNKDGLNNISYVYQGEESE